MHKHFLARQIAEPQTTQLGGETMMLATLPVSTLYLIKTSLVVLVNHADQITIFHAANCTHKTVSFSRYSEEGLYLRTRVRSPGRILS